MEQDIDYRGYKIKVRQDDFSESPDDWGDEGAFLVYNHRQFTIRREGFDPKDIYDALNEGLAGEENYYAKYYIFPVEAYIHSGVSLSLFTGTKQCRWDSSVTGFILVDKEVVLGYPNIASEQDKEDKAKELAEGLVEAWNQYLEGEVYGFRVEKPETYYEISKKDFDTMITTGMFTSKEFLTRCSEEVTWNEIDSCYGFYGDIQESGLLDEAKATVDCDIKHY